MFLTALAPPQPDRNFDGRVGIWRICEEKVCDRTTLYHQRGDIYIHDCTLDADLNRQYMVGTEDVDGVFDEIKIKMPWLRGHPVIVQQDGAPPHTGHDNVEFFNNKGHKDGWNITVVTQPAQSPDLNVNDLGIFRSLKYRVEQLKAEETTLENLYEAVLEAWNEYDSVTLERIWGHQFACYRSILEDQGGNSLRCTNKAVMWTSSGGPEIE